MGKWSVAQITKNAILSDPRTIKDRIFFYPIAGNTKKTKGKLTKKG